jgi:hypothetical protein
MPDEGMVCNAKDEDFAQATFMTHAIAGRSLATANRPFCFVATKTSMAAVITLYLAAKSF